MTAPIAVAGPFQGVRYVRDSPYEDAQKYLYYAENGYFRNSQSVVSWLARPGFTCTNPSGQMGTGQRSQGSVGFTDPTSGTIYNFFVVNGVLYRANSTFTTFTDVTPGAVAIDNAASTRVAFAVVGTSVVVTDGIHRPWVMTAFGSTPVTGAYIDIDGAAGAWTAWGKPTVYQDSVMFIAKTVPGGSAVTPRVGIVWSEPNQPTVGYTQTTYADFWNIIENNTEPLYAILGTNNGLFYWRANSIGVATGTPSIGFSTTATRDYRGDPVGTVSPYAVVLFEDNVFFLDAKGRPWMMPLLGNPQPIWQQLTKRLDALTPAVLDPSFLSYIAIGSAVPELNQVALIFAGDPTNANRASPFFASVFDGATGAYAGEWSLSRGLSSFDTMGVVLNSSGVRVLYVGGGLNSPGPSPTIGGYVWILNALTAGVWADVASGVAGITSSVEAETHEMGYAADRLLYPDSVTFIVRSGEAMSVTPVSMNASVTPITVTPTASGGFTLANRATLGLSGEATRFVAFDLGVGAPTLQWGITRVEVFGSVSATGPEDR